jgi:mannose-6-phosphate isomerase-like protein (cupin superfamily)
MRSTRLYGRVVNWTDLPREEVRPGVSRCAYVTDDIQLVMNRCAAGMALNPHVHDFDQLACIVSGHARYYIDDVPHEMVPGSMLLVPAGAHHYIEPLDAEVQNLDIFVPPRADLLHLSDYLESWPEGPS